jgi:Winged helix DNA-binding domain
VRPVNVTTPAAVDWGALGDYAKDVGQARRSPKAFDKKAAASGGTGDRERLSAFRACATHLDKRLAAGEHIEVAFGGLQDSAPRAGLLAIHARMKDVGPGEWEDAKLLQVWLRWADYLVPRRDVGVFTVGALPRRADQRSALHNLADAVVRVLDGRAKTARQVAESMPDLPTPTILRLCSVTGKVHIRWDAHTTVLLPAGRAEPAGTVHLCVVGVDEDEARRELARRFLAWLGPARAVDFAVWAGIGRDDAEATWRCLDRELVVVTVDGVEASLLARDEDAFSRPGAAAAGVRLLPMGGPYLYPRAALAVAAPPAELAERLRRDGVTSRVINSLTGRVLLDGRPVASWARSGAKVTLAAWQGVTGPARDRVEGEVDALRGPIGRPPTLGWLT